MPFPPAPPEKKSSPLSFQNLKKYKLWALAASLVGGPYAYFEGGEWTKDLSSGLRAITGESTGQKGPTTAALTGGPSLPHRSQASRTVAPSPVALPEIFRFDVTPEWVEGHWSDVSLGMADVSLTGYRVMLITGPNPADLAGSLTYYFDVDQRLQRIRFTGVTGDPRPLVAEMALRHRFMRCATDVPGSEVYQVHLHGKAQGEMRIRSAPTLSAGTSLGRYSVDLSIDRPE